MTPENPGAPVLPGNTPGSAGAPTGGAPEEQSGALREHSEQAERPDAYLAGMLLRLAASREQSGALRAVLRERRAHGLRARHQAKLDRLNTPPGETRDQPLLADKVGVMGHEGTVVRFDGGPLAGTERAKTTTGRATIYLALDGSPLSPSKGDRIRAAEGMERSPRAKVNACYVQTGDTYEPDGRRVITYRFITTEPTEWVPPAAGSTTTNPVP